MSERRQHAVSLTLGVLLICAMLYVAGEAAAYVTASFPALGAGPKAEGGGPCVVIDAGHGGIDPGKVGVQGTLEKDLNLAIAQRVKYYLEASDVRVVMTRQEDDGLYDASSSNKKVQDMKRRVALIQESAPLVTVSIHQNSYPEEYVHGAQVFYYTGSTEGKKLAARLQEQLVERTDPGNKRQIKENSSYYLLKKTSTPIVIVECGFLSNREEAEKLCSQEYQDRLAWAIHMGVLQYLNGESSAAR